MGEPQGTFIEQSFSVSSKGVFSVSDDRGNSFSLTVPTVASGISTSTLVGNSTAAVYETRVTAGPIQLADVKLTFSVYKQFCQPAGVRLEISGTEDWGSTDSGLVKVVFDKAPLSRSSYRAYFGNVSGTALGFDWSDSESLLPSYSPSTWSLTYTVGSNFFIDPVTISSGSSQSTGWGYQRLVFYTQGLHWAFYGDGSNYVFRTSSDGITWSVPTTIRSQTSSLGGFAVWQWGSKVYYAVATSANNFAYDSGTLSSAGSISWLAETQVPTSCASNSVSVVVDTNGNPWVAIGEGCTSEKLTEVYEYTNSWNLVGQFNPAVNPGLVPLTAGKLALLYQNTCTTSSIMITEWSGTAFSTPVATGSTSYCLAYGDAVAVGDTVYLAAAAMQSGASPGTKFLYFPYGGNSWSTEATIVKTGLYASITSDSSGDLVYTTTTGNYNGVYYNISRNQGVTWMSPTSLNSISDSYPELLTTAYTTSTNLPPALWVAGTSSPYNVRFSAIPINVQDAALSSNSWSRPGLSPYESYFSHFSDYVSPGNGLVSVEAGTLDLPGRGLDFAPSLVYTEPYVFQTAPPSIAGYVTADCTGSCATPTLTTSATPTLLYATILVDSGKVVSGVTSSPALTWQKRASVNLPVQSGGFDCGPSSLCEEETWYATDQSQFSGTVTINPSGTAAVKVVVIAVTGVNTGPGLIFDTNGAVPCTGTSTSGPPACTLSTSNPGDLILGSETDGALQTCSAGGPFTLVESSTSIYPGDVCLEDFPTSSTRSNLVVTTSSPSCASYHVCAIIGDAIAGLAPYQYDSYTGANLGIGWALDLPWLGANYLHLSDGQAYPYSWSGNTFQYNGATNFVLTSNTGGTYTLTLPSGTVYQFDSSKRLTSITDRTGNNAISFSYGSNNYISQVTDTIGRTATFSYNGNNQLTTITSGTRTWALGYTGSQLTSLIDPLNRVTTFQYAGITGASAWLLSAVVWPTGGEMTYTYGSAPVGTEVSTYYATSRNVYYESTHLSQTQSISYAITNGQVTWSNSTISDGTTTRSYLDYNFQSSKNLMKVYAKDGSGTLQRIAETDSDASGRTNATKTYSPTGALLAQSTFAYDNWGNVIYSRDNLGQQAWFSYANTNSAGTLGSSGCTTSFYTQTISSSIHDLLIGSCDYQNGSGSPQQQAYYSYDANGNMLEVKVLHSGGWQYTDHIYDGYGNVLKTTDADGHVANFRYSSTYGSAYLTKTSALAGSQNVTTTFTYDLPTGNMLSTTDPNGQTTSYQYDALGRTTLVTYPAVGGVSATRQYSYDDTNNIITTTDEDGHVTKGYFDELARQTKAEQWNGSSVYSTEYFTYN